MWEWLNGASNLMVATVTFVVGLLTLIILF